MISSNDAERKALRVGTSAFTANGWNGTFYPKGLPQTECLTYYSRHFDTVEIDATLYGPPVLSTVESWYSKTPEGFVFTAKVPQTITHKKILRDCELEMMEFVRVMDALHEKLGPLLLQFSYFNQRIFPSVTEFLGRLVPFLKFLPSDHKFAVEIRNRSWLVPQFVDTLREHGVALALIDHPWMPRPAQYFEAIDPITADFTYVRWLGDRKGIEEQTKTWNRLIVDRQTELSDWSNVLEKVYERNVQIYTFANNHYAGYSPATVDMFRKLWRKDISSRTASVPAEPQQASLFT